MIKHQYPVVPWLSFAIMNADTMSSDGIQARLDELQKELIRKTNSKQDYNAIPIKSLRCASRNHKPRQTPAAARRHRNASLSCRTSSEAGNPKSPDSTKASSECLSNRFTLEFKSGITIDIKA